MLWSSQIGSSLVVWPGLRVGQASCISRYTWKISQTYVLSSMQYEVAWNGTVTGIIWYSLDLNFVNQPNEIYVHSVIQCVISAVNEIFNSISKPNLCWQVVKCHFNTLAKWKYRWMCWKWTFIYIHSTKTAQQNEWELGRTNGNTFSWHSQQYQNQNIFMYTEIIFFWRVHMQYDDKFV